MDELSIEEELNKKRRYLLQNMIKNVSRERVRDREIGKLLNMRRVVREYADSMYKELTGKKVGPRTSNGDRLPGELKELKDLDIDEDYLKTVLTDALFVVNSNKENKLKF
jgi:hypothetical protein